MKDFNEIDNLFRDTIEPFEIAPSDKVWQSVQGNLQKKSALAKERTIRNLRYSVAASVTAFCLAVAYHYYTPQNQNTIAALPAAAKTITGKLNPATSSLVSTNNTTGASSANTVQNKTAAAKNEVQNSLAQPVINIAPSEKANTNENVTVNEPAQKTPAIASDVNRKENNPVKNNPVISPVVITDNTPKKENTNSTQNNTADVNQKKGADAPGLNSDLPVTAVENVIYVPNAFTPNGDGLNDFFQPKAAEDLKEYRLTIFDFHGNVIFTTDDINKGWDGKSVSNGQESVKEDVYVYRIEIRTSKNESLLKKGTLTLVK